MYIERDIEKSIFEWLEEREIIALTGPRQCGKTTLLHQIRQKVIDAGTYDGDHVIYRSLDEETERMNFSKNPVDHINGLFIDDAPHLLLLDEVQYVENAGLHLKVIFDRFHERMKLIITGSSGLDLRNIGGSLVGRVVYFEMYPFSFKEFLLARDRKMHRYFLEHRLDLEGDRPADAELNEPAHLDRLNSLMEEYITYGGFPRIVLMGDLSKKETLLRQLISMCIEKDILLLYGQTFRKDAYRILKYLAFHCGGILNQADLSSNLGIDKNRVGETIGILEDAHIIKTVRPFYKSMTTELRKRPKIYFIDIGIRNALAEDFAFSREKGFLLEGFVLSQMLNMDSQLKYWRTTAKAEVDFVLKGPIPIEVKSTPKITRAFRSFISTYKPPMGLVVNYDSTCVHKVNGTKVYYVPACLL